jgi:hypothetical protein
MLELADAKWEDMVEEQPAHGVEQRTLSNFFINNFPKNNMSKCIFDNVWREVQN